MANRKSIGEIISSNPFAAIATAITIGSLVFSALTFYVVATTSPITQRVQALEDKNEYYDTLVPQFITLQSESLTDRKNINQNILEMRQDLRDIKNYLNVK